MNDIPICDECQATIEEVNCLVGQTGERTYCEDCVQSFSGASDDQTTMFYAMRAKNLVHQLKQATVKIESKNKEGLAWLM